MNSIMSSDVANQSKAQQRRVAPSSSNLPTVDERAASDEVRTLFAQYRERFARTDLPGIVLCFATNPALLKGMMQIAEGLMFGESLLNRRHKEMIAAYVSQQNACPYCADSHSVLLRAQGGSPEEICALRQTDLDAQLFTKPELALLTFSGKLNTNSSAVTRDEVEAVMAEGWTEPQVAEAIHVTALFAAFNRIANGFGLPTPYPDGF